jgi:tetratricopeptide (TPR) repeat protein
MLLCPTCSRELSDEPVCKCGTDVSLLHQIVARADHLFNQALEAHQAGQTARALEYLEANATLVPFDIEARLVQTKLLAQLERWEEAEAIIQRVQASEPNHPELERLIEVLAGRQTGREESSVDADL